MPPQETRMRSSLETYDLATGETRVLSGPTG